jgi:uncharacterized protein (TIGR04141 family)
VARSIVVADSGESAVTAAQVGLVLVDLHAKLMLPDADVRDLHAALGADDGCTWSIVDAADGSLRAAVPTPDDRLSVVVRRRPAGTARWKPFLRGLGVPLNAVTDPETESVLVIVRTATEPVRTVVWCFGAASLVVPNDLVDGRFGLIVALNKHTAGTAIGAWRHLPEGTRRRLQRADPRAQVRQLSSTVRDGYRHSVVAKGVAAAPVEGLRFDSMSDYLRGVVVRTEDELMPDLEGGRGLKLATYLDGWSDLAALADHLAALRERTDYRDDWDWVDHVVPVAPRAEAERLLTELGRIVVDDPDATVDIVLPELEGGDVAAAELAFRIGNESVWHRPIEWRHIRARLLQAAPGPVAPLHRKVRIKSGSAPVQEFPLRDLLVGEFRAEERQYVLGDGELLEVKADFLQRLDAAVAAVPLSTFPFPTYRGGTEPEYVQTAPTRSGDRLVMLDDRPVQLRGETPFEACDLFADDGRLVFAKQKGRSSTFSHLCTQAEVAAEMFLQHGPARDELLTRIADRAKSVTMEDSALGVATALERRSPDTVTVTLLLLGPWRRLDLTTLPLVSRVRLRRAALRITNLGYRFEVAVPATEKR